ncbi:hypothetical protein [Streptomyces sp. NPDC005423]|uniref:hypothetical protein n=1 Tax=Streptomyces sp. NPDC005423 TaxID=3155343 RepID=UPI0033AE222F
MQTESAIENHAPSGGRRRKRGGNGSGGSVAGPVFVDNSGRRSKFLRRLGLLMGAVCLGYAFVLGMAFMGWGLSLNPSSLLPFGNGQAVPNGDQPLGGRGGIRPPSAPTAVPSDAPRGVTPSPSATAD